MLYKEDANMLMVSEDDFYKEIEELEDIKIDNLEGNDLLEKALNSDIVMFVGQGARTVIMKNRFGKEGSIV